MSEDLERVDKCVDVTADVIFGLQSMIPIQPFDIPGAGRIYIHGFTAMEKADWQKECRQEDGKVDIDLVEPLMFQMCVRDSKGARLFKATQIGRIRLLPAAIVTRVCDICMELSGIGAASDAAILKNFAPIDIEDS